jgi:hypothetical protein
LETDRAGTALPEFQDILDFGGVAINGAGVVLVRNGIGTTESGQTINAYHYTPGKGWDVEVVATIPSGTAFHETHIAWLETSGESVATYFGASQALDSTVYTNGSWSGAPAIPGAYYGEISSLAQAPSGPVVLLEDGSLGGVNAAPSGPLANWLNP